MGTTTHLSAAQLDELAHAVAGWLDEDVLEPAWQATRDMEAAAGLLPDERRPASAPVIGRRFAAAHRRLSVAAVTLAAPRTRAAELAVCA